MVQFIYNFFVYFLRPVYKWLLHVFTGKCEIERILAGADPLGPACFKIEEALTNSRSPMLQNILKDSSEHDVPDLARVLFKFKCIKSNIANRLQPKLLIILHRLVAYRKLKTEVELLRRLKYNQENDEHESLLLKVWEYLQPDTPLESRVTKQWQIVGFQGDNPATDFRGMGLLGLVQLLYFCERHTKACRRIFQRSFHPHLGYPFAIASINFTSVSRQLLVSEALKYHVYHTPGSDLTLNDFHEIFCCIFCMFDEMWFEDCPLEGVMAFNATKDKLQAQLVAHCTQDRLAIEKYLEDWDD